MEQQKYYLLDNGSLNDDETTYSPIDEVTRTTESRRRWSLFQHCRAPLWLFVFAILLGYTAGILTAFAGGIFLNHHFNLEPSYSPARSAVQLELQQLQFPAHGEYSRFAGEPRQETDEAWHDLTAPLMIQASREEMERGGENPDISVRLADGGYLASTGVYHELHCLKRMRWYLYRDTYYQNLTEKQDAYLRGHIDHCIETLRILSMCQADVSLYSYEWRTHENYTRQERKSSSKKVCIKWDRLAAWMEERSVTWEPKLIAPES